MNRTFFSALSIGCLLLSSSLLPSSLLAQQGKSAGLPVVTATVTEEVTPELKVYVGTVLPLKRAVVGSAVDGRVTDVFVDVGDRVEVDSRGLAPLAQLLTETIKLEHEAAQAELKLRQQELGELETGAREEEKQQAEAQLLGARAMMDFTKARAKRNQEIYQQSQGISSDEVEQSMASAEQMAQSFAEAKANYDLVITGPRTERIEQARARVAMQQAMTNQIADRIKKYTVVSRFSGYVVSKMAEEGQWVKQGDPVAEVVHLDQVEVEVHVTEQQVNNIRVGSKTYLDIPAAGKEPFEGTVSAIVPQADVRTRTFPVRILVPNRFVGEEAVIKSGMYARAKLSSGGTQKSKLVPKDALVLGGAQPMIFVVEGGKVRPVPVELGGGYQDRIQVTGNLKAGQQVVVEGNERLRPGQVVEVIRTMEVSTDNRSTTGGGNQ